MTTNMESSERPLDASNRGFRLLQKMGWTPGVGLGKCEQGIVEPLKMKENLVQLGLGKSEEYDEMTQAATSERRKLAAELAETEDEEAKRLARAEREDQVRAEVKSSESAFYCEDCSKQYKTVKEMENHLSSYDHHHRKRQRDLQRQVRLANADDGKRLKRRRDEQQQEELMLQRRIQQAAAEATTEAKQGTSKPDAAIDQGAEKPVKTSFTLGKGFSMKKPAKKAPLGISSAFSQS